MPHDANNNLLQKGDNVILEAVIEDVAMNEEYCNVKVRVTNSAKPFDNPNAMREFWFNAAQLKKTDASAS